MKIILSTIILLIVHLVQAQNIDANVSDLLCFGEGNGAIDITFTEGNPPYMYQWSTGANTQDIEDLNAGSYSITITDSQDMSYTGTWDILEPTPIVVDGVVQDPHCSAINGALDGSIDVFAFGGTESFSFLWSGPGVDGATTESLFDVVQGLYYVTVTDDNGCTAEAEFEVVEPDPIELNANIQNLDCVDGQSQFGSIELNVVGGFPPYTYYWEGAVTDPFAQTQSELSAGTYTVEVTDANGCFVSEDYILTGAEPIEINATLTNVSCVNAETAFGSIDLDVSGGVPPYVYSWSGNDVDQTSQNQSGLNLGIYYVTVSDSEGCQLVEAVYEIQSDNIESPSICLITNDNPDGYNTVYWESPEDITGIDHYNIYREGSSIGEFDLLGSVAVDLDNQFFDTDANSIQQAYRYFVTAANACSYESDPSDIHKTIHLTINQGSFGNINLIWDEYDGIEYDQIAIFRGDSPSTLEELVVLPGNVFSYTDDNTLEGDAYYQVVITTAIDCNVSESNAQKILFELKSNVAGFIVNGVEEVDWVTNVYPSPFRQVLTIDVERAVQAEFFDMHGHKHAEYQLSTGHNVLSTTDLPNGIYSVRLLSNDEAVVWRGIKY